MLKRFLVFVGVTGFTVSLIWWLFQDSATVGDDSAALEFEGPRQTISETLGDRVRQLPEPEPEPEPAPSLFEQPPEAESIVEEDSVPESCIDASTAGFQFAEDIELDEGLCDSMAAFVSGRLVPALPGLLGYDIPDTNDPFRQRLIDEPDNPSWSRLTESQIYAEMQERLDFPVVTLQAECRTSTCGLLFAYAQGTNSDTNYNRLGMQLADTFGFSGYYGGYAVRSEHRMGFTYLYLGNWVTERPDEGTPVSTLPSTFEEFRDSIQESPEPLDR